MNTSAAVTQEAEISIPAHDDALYALIRSLTRQPEYFWGHDELALQRDCRSVKWTRTENRTCGDALTLALRQDDGPGMISQVTAQLCYAGYFCALCMATAELICKACAIGGIDWEPAVARPVPTPTMSCSDADLKIIVNNIESLKQAVAKRPARLRCVDLPFGALRALGGRIKEQNCRAKAGL